MQFVQWLPSSIEEFKDKTPDEVVTILNKLSQTEEGMKTISGLINQFKQNTSMFKDGGKLGQLINKFQQGGKSDQRKSDKIRKDFHGVSLFEYGPNKYKTARGTLARDLKPGIHQEILPNGVGLRQITRNNTTTSELVSPDKRDTLYINNASAGRIDSNINDAGILGKLGLRTSTPVSSNFRRLQNIFRTEKFGNGGETISPIKRDTTEVDRTVSPSGNSFRDRKIQIISTFPNGHQEVRDIERIIYPMSQDTSYFQTTSNYLPNGNIMNVFGPNKFTPDSKIKNKMK